MSGPRRQWKHGAKAVSLPRRQWKHRAKTVPWTRKQWKRKADALSYLHPAADPEALDSARGQRPHRGRLRRRAVHAGRHCSVDSDGQAGRRHGARDRREQVEVARGGGSGGEADGSNR